MSFSCQYDNLLLHRETFAICNKITQRPACYTFFFVQFVARTRAHKKKRIDRRTPICMQNYTNLYIIFFIIFAINVYIILHAEFVYLAFLTWHWQSKWMKTTRTMCRAEFLFCHFKLPTHFWYFQLLEFIFFKQIDLVFRRTFSQWISLRFIHFDRAIKPTIAIKQVRTCQAQQRTMQLNNFTLPSSDYQLQLALIATYVANLLD